MAILTQEQIQAEDCQKEIAAVLAKHGFALHPYVTIVQGQIEQGIRIVKATSAPLASVNKTELQAAMGGPINGG